MSTFSTCVCLQTATSCKKLGAPAVDIHAIDLSKSEEVRKFAKDVLDKHKNVDVLVNNAGMAPSSGNGPISGTAPFSHTIIQLSAPQGCETIRM